MRYNCGRAFFPPTSLPFSSDQLSFQAAHRMSRFPPEPSVLTTIKMTRTAYAQLVGQKFFPPKIFGRWKENEGTDEWRWRDVGMKIVRVLYSVTTCSLLSPLPIYRLAVSKCSTRRARVEQTYLVRVLKPSRHLFVCFSDLYLLLTDARTGRLLQ